MDRFIATSPHDLHCPDFAGRRIDKLAQEHGKTTA